MKLYDYQQKLIDELYCLEKTHKKIAFCAATGSGKSVMLAHLALNALKANEKVLILVHRKLLIDQLAGTLKNFGINCGYIKSGYPYEPNKNIFVGSVQTLDRRLIDIEFDRIVLDEAHITAFAKASKKILDTHPNAKVTMFTATPFPSTRKRNLYHFCKTQVIAPTPVELMDMGYLSKDEYYVFPTYSQEDIDNLKVNTYGEYSTGELSKMCRKPESIKNIVNEHLRLAGNRAAIVFAADVAHSMALEEAFNAAGIKATHIDGTTKKADRNRIYESFRDRKTQVLINCAVLTEGADFPFVGCVILATPYRSQARYIQAVGRGLRVAQGKTECLILDHGQNAVRLGRARDLSKYDYTLREWRKSNCTAPTKVCPECYHLNYVVVNKCAKCGHEFPIVEKTDINPIVGHLQKLEDRERLELPPMSINDFRKEYSKLIKGAFYGKRSAGMPMAVWYQKYKDYDIKDMSAITTHTLLGKTPNEYHLRKFANWIMDYIVKKGKTIEDYRRMIVRELDQLVYNDEIKLVLNHVWNTRKHEITQNSQ